MIALTNLFIHDAHEPSMTAASDILRKPACISRQEAPTLTEGAGTCRTEDGDQNTSANRPESHKAMGKKGLAEKRKTPRPRSGRVILLNGASSAGKSTLARNLRLLLKEEAMIFSMDDYLAMSQGKHETALDAVRMFCWSASGAALTGPQPRPMPSASTRASTAISRMISP